jgi:hypothetical protein
MFMMQHRYPFGSRRNRGDGSSLVDGLALASPVPYADDDLFE